MSTARTILITGAGKRLGSCLAASFAEAGWRVAIHCHHSVAEAQALRERLGERHVVLTADLRDLVAARKLVDEAVEYFGGLDCLLNNASVYVRKSLADTTAEDFLSAYQVNCLAPLTLMQEYAARLGKGCIINILDSRIDSVDGRSGAYLLAKKTLRDLTLALAQTWAPRLRVNGVAPGLVMSPPGVPQGKIQRLERLSPLGRSTSPDEIAAACLLLANSPSMTGEIIRLDSGLHLLGQDWGEPNTTDR